MRPEKSPRAIRVLARIDAAERQSETMERVGRWFALLTRVHRRMLAMRRPFILSMARSDSVWRGVRRDGLGDAVAPLWLAWLRGLDGAR